MVQKSQDPQDPPLRCVSLRREIMAQLENTAAAEGTSVDALVERLAECFAGRRESPDCACMRIAGVLPSELYYFDAPRRMSYLTLRLSKETETFIADVARLLSSSFSPTLAALLKMGLNTPRY